MPPEAYESAFRPASDSRLIVVLCLIALSLSAAGSVLTLVFLEIPSVPFWLAYVATVQLSFGLAWWLARANRLTAGYAVMLIAGTVTNSLYPFLVPSVASAAVFCFSCTITFLTGLGPGRVWWRFPVLIGIPTVLFSIGAGALHPAVNTMELAFIVVHGAVAVMAAAVVSKSRHGLRQRNHATQAQLIATDRMASLGVIAAGLGHEINNPLAYIQLNLKSVLASDKVGLEDRDALTDAMEGAKRIEQVVKNLGFFARPEQRTVVLEVAPILESTIDLVRPQFRHRGTLETAVDGLIYIEDANGRLGQVALNLITNAIQATREREGARIVVSTRVDGEEVDIMVDDNGPGVPVRLRNRVFDSFFTTKGVGDGTGLGLAICKHLVSDAGGTIFVSDSDMGGARFTVRLPRAYPSGDVFVKKPARTLQVRPRVLVIDDDARVASAMARALRNADVEVVESGEKGLSELQREAFDVVFCDVMMPGLSGLDVYNQVQARDSAMAKRFVFVTGGAYAGVSHADLVATGRPLLKKPVKAETLRQSVFDAVSDKSPLADDTSLKRSA